MVQASSYHGSATGSDTPPWRGVNHARMTRSTFSLSAGAFKVLAALRRVVKDGECRDDLSQAKIADLAKVSEATVSRSMPQLAAGGFLRWEKQDAARRGRGAGHVLTMLPPPELRRAVTVEDAPQEGSACDPSAEAAAEPTETPETPAEKGSLSDPSILHVHQTIPPPTPPIEAGGGGAAPQPEEPNKTERFLQEHGFSTAREFRHLDYEAVRKAVRYAEQHGTGPGALVKLWRVCPPRPASATYTTQPAAPPGEYLSGEELRALAARLNPFAPRGGCHDAS